MVTDAQVEAKGDGKPEVLLVVVRGIDARVPTGWSLDPAVNYRRTILWARDIPYTWRKHGMRQCWVNAESAFWSGVHIAVNAPRVRQKVKATGVYAYLRRGR